MDSKTFYHYASPVGLLILQSDEYDRNISRVLYATQREGYSVGDANEKPTIIHRLEHELDLYFSGDIKKFKTPFLMQGTDFQKQVYEETLKIPYGSLSTYASIASSIDNEKARRAVGSALARNKTIILIPCHRIVSSVNHSLIGYAGGLQAKQYLIGFEVDHSKKKK